MKALLLFTKQFFFILFLIVLPLLGQAQKSDSTQQYQTLFGDSKAYGGYGALSLGYTKIGSNDAFVSGIKGAWIIGHNIGIGVEGAGFFSEIKTDNNNNQEYSVLAGGYGGLLIEPIFFALKPLHFATPIVFGGGAVVYESGAKYGYGYIPDNYQTDYDQFYMIQPGLELELNITRFFRMSLGGNYRFTSNINLTTTDYHSVGDVTDDEIIQILDNNDLNNFSFYLSLKFGKF